MDENYNILPHGVNFQDAIFPDTQENRRIFSSLFQFSNCSHGQPLQTFTPDWEIQEDNRVTHIVVSLAHSLGKWPDFWSLSKSTFLLLAMF